MRLTESSSEPDLTGGLGPSLSSKPLLLAKLMMPWSIIAG